MVITDVLAEARRADLGGDCLAVLELPEKPGRFVVVVNDDYPSSGTVDWYGHGLTTLAVAWDSGQLTKIPTHRLNNRISARTLVRLTGPAAGSTPVTTSRDPSGSLVLGTLGHEAAVVTPWGTVLSRETLPARYFSCWAEVDGRFDSVAEPNELHRFGWVLEVDPHKPEALPCKRTALGRSASAVTEVRISPDGRVEVLMTGRYRFKFVSHRRTRHRRDWLDTGRLEACLIPGEWTPLAEGQVSHVPGMTAEEVLVFSEKAVRTLTQGWIESLYRDFTSRHP